MGKLKITLVANVKCVTSALHTRSHSLSTATIERTLYIIYIFYKQYLLRFYNYKKYKEKKVLQKTYSYKSA